ncbi:MAG: hypothetical protein M1505_02645 [Patescibacteria group bacterium]|nr:hypothetical protein [Patescibacteria group bacterium]
MEIISEPETQKITGPTDLNDSSQAEPGDSRSGPTYFLLFSLLGLAIWLDLVDIIADILDIPTGGLVGWIIRLILGVFRLIYFGLFLYLSYRPEFSGGKSQLNRARRNISIITRLVTGGEVVADELPIIGTIVSVLPLETISVIFLFFLWPKIASHFETTGQDNGEVISRPSQEIAGPTISDD